jgi:hypothetical protein
MLTPAAAEEDAEKLFAALSSIFHQAVFYNLIYPTQTTRLAGDGDFEKIRSLESPHDFLQHMLSSLGLNRINFQALLVAVLKNTYNFIISDLEEHGLSYSNQDILTNWTHLFYRLYPALHPTGSSPPKTTRKVKIAIHSHEVFSAAISPRFAAALRMLSIRQAMADVLPPVVITPDRRHEPFPESITVRSRSRFISAPDLAFLANVSYPYITLLCRKDQLPTRKEGKFIFIPISAAVAFAASRPNAPTFVQTLATRIAEKPDGI